MPYVAGRTIHDADSHVFEPPGYAESYADPAIRERLVQALEQPAWGTKPYDEALAQQDEPEMRARNEEEIMLRKGLMGLGAIRNTDRPEALDLLGFATQLVFTTAYLGSLLFFEIKKDPELAYGLARAHNRGMVDFCSVDDRLLPVCYVPMADIDRSVEEARIAIDMGAAALMLPSHPPKHHSPSHIGFDRLWAQAEEAGVPVVFHVGGEKPMDPVYKENGLPPVPDFNGGDKNFTSVSYLAIPYAPMQTLGTMIIDGVLERFPDLRIGLIELGASWVPGWMRSLDSAAEAFRKNEERLQRMTLKPSELIRRQVRVTPYPHESAGWVVRECGPDMAMFSSDFPHHEGGRNPMKRFEQSLEGCTDTEKDRFYRANFEDLMGSVLRRVGQPVVSQRAPADALQQRS